jgi:hypothetical protein
MKRILTLIFAVSIFVSMFGCSPANSDNGSPQTEASTEEGSETGNVEDSIIAVTKLVVDFGGKLQLVSLLGDDVKDSMQENYGEYVSPELLSKWREDPQNAPGRLVSSPWPDRIEIMSVDKLSDETYKVEGYIIEVTSAEAESGGAAAKRAVALEVGYFSDKWMIEDVTLGDYVTDAKITYANDQYGFDFTLPESWQGYTLIEGTWNGTDLASGKQTESGPMITIRHPEWTQKNPRQDIPIMIFTLSEWEAVQNETLGVSAAPVPPSELGRNSVYVFALPPRYNFAFPEGYEEVEDIIAGNPLEPAE